MPENQRRAPAVPKNIEEIDPRDDIRVRIVGTVIDKGNDSIDLDDGTGKVEIFLEEEALDQVGEGDRIRVLGRVLPTPESFEIQGEIVQQFDGVEPEIHDRVKKVVNTSE